MTADPTFTDPNKSVPTFCRTERAIGKLKDENVRLIFASEEEWRKQTAHPKNDPRFRQKSRAKAIVTSRRFALAVIFLVITILAISIYRHRETIDAMRLRINGVPPGLYSKDGALYVGDDIPFFIKGSSWYGMEEEGRVLGGFDKTSVLKVLNFLAKNNFNAVRVPLSVENIMDKSQSQIMSNIANSDYIADNYIDFLRTFTRQAAKKGILVLLDIHRLDNRDITSKGYWYSTDIPEIRLKRAWEKLCKRLGDEWNIMGADLFNEPWDALWGNANKTEDWKAAAEELGDQIHEECPSWTLFIQGVGGRPNVTHTNVFWAENLRVMEHKPPELKLRNKVVLSPHVYGPGVHNQTYFETENFPGNMPDIWDDHFGTVHNETGFATVVGEWGGFYTGKDKIWQDKFFEYLAEKGMGFFYWCVNPESGDTGGLLQKDWMKPEHAKLKLLESARSTDVLSHAEHFKHLRGWRTGNKR